MAVTNGNMGPRLEFVVRELKDVQARRRVTKYDKKLKKLVHTTSDVGETLFMVYTPAGNSYRLTHDELKKWGFDRAPAILNLERVTDATSAAGRFKYGVNEETRLKAYRELEEQVIKLCERKHGKATTSVEEQEYAAAS